MENINQLNQLNQLNKHRNWLNPIPQEVLSIIIGSLLGDAHAEKRGDTTRITFQQEDSNMEYLLHNWKTLSCYGYVSQETPKLATRIGQNGKLRRVIRFRTWSYVSFNWIHELFYGGLNGVKWIPRDIEVYLTPLALAVWIMDNGTKSGSGVTISTNSFTYEDILFICDVLYRKYNITAKPNKCGAKNQWVIYIHKVSMPILTNLILTYMTPSMYRKLHL